MKYMMIMNTPKDGYTQYMNWPKKILEANGAFMETFTKKLAAAGELVGAEGLAAPDQARLVRAGKDGKPITDGVFAESKEFLAGYWIIDVDSHERAIEVAAEASTAPGATVIGADGKPIEHLWIELRQIMSGRQDIG
ncbi:MAG: YciI family protein [Gemmatimonadaceae bacterium]